MGPYVKVLLAIIHGSDSFSCGYPITDCRSEQPLASVCKQDYSSFRRTHPPHAGESCRRSCLCAGNQENRYDIDQGVERHAAADARRGGGDRTSVVEGKSVAVRVDLGGGRCVKKNKNK